MQQRWIMSLTNQVQEKTDSTILLFSDDDDDERYMRTPH